MGRADADGALARLARSTRDGARVGARRARDSLEPILWVGLACGLAYALAGWLLDHRYPFFAAVAAFSALGFSPDVQPRRVGEYAVGITVGVGLGELAQAWLGSGPLQVAGVVIAASLIARAISPSVVLTTQSSVQAIVVLGLPAIAANGGPFGRWLDALVGGAVALAFSLFMPKDPRKRPRHLAREALADLAAVLELVATALETGDSESAERALRRARGMQGELTALQGAVSASGSTARLSPAWRRHRGELMRLDVAAEHIDRAVRTARVLARRVATAHGLVDEEVAARCDALAAAAARLSETLARGHDLAPACDLVERAAGHLTIAGERDPMRHTLTSLLRSIAHDLDRAAGADPARAARALP